MFESLKVNLADSTAGFSLIVSFLQIRCGNTFSNRLKFTVNASTPDFIASGEQGFDFTQGLHHARSAPRVYQIAR
jgi:hypothetical protein